MLRFAIIFLTTLFSLHFAQWCDAFNANGRWTSTATDNPVQILGRSVTLTWSIVPDGTTVPGVSFAPSNLIADFDTFYGDIGGGDLTSRSWFPVLEQSFDRWSEISGINFVYEPNDDGASHGDFTGELGVRGDIRLAGAGIDGNGGTLAQAGFIPNADITFDTSDTVRYGNLNSNSFNLRHTLMHEIGHSLGLGHIESFNSAILLEPFSQTGFEGPQFDDIRGVHHLYGDALEKDNLGGNNSPTTATSLGIIGSGQTFEVGIDASNSAIISLSQNDFVSISNILDQDYFEFSIESPMTVDLVLDPVGPTYSERIFSGQQFTTVTTSSMNDLQLEIYSFDGVNASLLHTASNGGLGVTETLSDIELAEAGEYLVRVAGSSNNVQLYNISIEAEELVIEPPLFAGDFNEDGRVDAADYTVWRDLLGTSGPLPNEEQSIGMIDAADYDTWITNYGNILSNGLSTAVPEPLGWILISLGAGLFAARRNRAN